MYYLVIGRLLINLSHRNVKTHYSIWIINPLILLALTIGMIKKVFKRSLNVPSQKFRDPLRTFVYCSMRRFLPNKSIHLKDWLSTALHINICWGKLLSSLKKQGIYSE